METIKLPEDRKLWRYINWSELLDKAQLEQEDIVELFYNTKESNMTLNDKDYLMYNVFTTQFIDDTTLMTIFPDIKKQQYKYLRRNMRSPFNSDTINLFFKLNDVVEDFRRAPFEIIHAQGVTKSRFYKFRLDHGQNEFTFMITKYIDNMKVEGLYDGVDIYFDMSKISRADKDKLREYYDAPYRDNEDVQNVLFKLLKAQFNNDFKQLKDYVTSRR